MAREQVLRFGEINMQKTDEEDMLYFLSGKRMYVIGAMSGHYPPLGWRRPGFLVGKRISEVGEEQRPVMAAHYLYEMGGAWAHPVKALENLTYSLCVNGGECQQLLDSYRFVNRLSHVNFFYEREGIAVKRWDFVVEEEPAFFSTLSLTNTRLDTAHVKVTLQVETNLMPSWFSGWSSGQDCVEQRDNVVVATDSHWRGKWAVVFGSRIRPNEYSAREATDRRQVATLGYELTLEPNETHDLTFLFVVESLRGEMAALERFERLIDREEEVLVAKQDSYHDAILGNVRFACSDHAAEQAFYNAKANLVQLQANLSPFLGKYYYAGLPEYVQLFGTDTAYSIPGILAAGQFEWARSSLSELARFAQLLCGRVPHEVTTNGRVFHPGNTPETPQFTIAAWNYYKWTGDRHFLEQVYPLCAEGVLDYLLAHWDQDLDYYPDGNATVEREGMGPEKLDSIVYFTRALFTLGAMASELGYTEDGERHLELARSLREAVNRDFWMEEESIFADSLAEDHTKQFDGHWVVVTPMEADIADRDKGARALDRIEREWVNEYGMVHTREREELVWTLPTGLLALAAFAYGRVDLGWKMLEKIALTTVTGSLGTFKELIPEGLCFMQLWSPGMFLQGMVEGMFGVRPHAANDYAEVFPKLPTGWSFMRLEALKVGSHELDIQHERNGEERVSLAHRGPRPFRVRLSVTGDSQTSLVDAQNRTLPVERDRRWDNVLWIDVDLAPREGVVAVRRGNVWQLQKGAPELVSSAQRAV